MSEGRAGGDSRAPDGADHVPEVPAGYRQQLLTGGKRLPGFTGEWQTRPLVEVAVVTMGQSPPSASYNIVGDGLPLIQGNADIVGRTTIERIWTTCPRKRCAAGDIVLTVRAPVGSVARANKDACLGRGVCGLKPLAEGQFLYYALILAEANWENVEQGSTFSAANSGQVARFPVAVPIDKLEQQAIAAVLAGVRRADRIAGSADRQETGHQAGHDAATADGEDAAAGVRGGMERSAG